MSRFLRRLGDTLPSGRLLAVLLGAVAVLLTAIMLLEWPVLRHTHGNLIYPSDDAFVNVSVARTFSFYQVWGISKHAFQSASSSLLYPLVLAPVFFIAGAHLWIPLVINFLAAAYFLLALQRVLINNGLPPARQLVVLLEVMALTLLPLLVVSGAEYTLQLLFVFLFMDALSKALADPLTTAAPSPTMPAHPNPMPANPNPMPPLSNPTPALSNPTPPLSNPTPALSNPTPALSNPNPMPSTPNPVPMLSIPNPSPMPSTPHPVPTPSTPLPRKIYIYGLLIVATRYEDLIIIALACLLLTPLRGWKTALRLGAVSILPVILFGVISRTKGSYFLPNSLLMGPYPGQAIFLAFCALCAAIPLLGSWLRLNMLEKTKAVPYVSLALLAILTLPFAARNLAGLDHFRRDCFRIYDQEYPTARFVHLYYYKMPVGIDEPGTVSWFSEGRKLDFTGIANSEVIRSKKRKDWSPLYADSLGRRDGIRAAIVTDPSFTPKQLPKWNIIATWKIPDSSPNRGPCKTVSFYALDQYDTARLRRNLHEYQRLLPPDVAVRYY